MLRSLPLNPQQDKLGAYTALLTKLEAAKKDQKIQKEKKAVACIDNLIKDVHQYFRKIQETRDTAIELYNFMTTW